MKKFWKSLRGYKRQAGAILVIIPMLLSTFGIDNAQADNICKMIEVLGALIWGIGWVDRGAVAVQSKNKKAGE